MGGLDVHEGPRTRAPPPPGRGEGGASSRGAHLCIRPDALEQVIIVGAALRDAQDRGAQVPEEHPTVKEVRAVVLTKGSPHVLAKVPSVLRLQGFKTHALEIVGCAMQCAVSMDMQPWLTTAGSIPRLVDTR